MKKVTMNGVSYIGELTLGDKGKTATLKNAMELKGSMTKATVAKYFKKRNIGELNTIEFGGKGTAYAVAELLPEEAMMVKMAEVVMEWPRVVPFRLLKTTSLMTSWENSRLL